MTAIIGSSPIVEDRKRGGSSVFILTLKLRDSAERKQTTVFGSAPIVKEEHPLRFSPSQKSFAKNFESIVSSFAILSPFPCGCRTLAGYSCYTRTIGLVLTF